MVVLGSTGSIGRGALDIARRFNLGVEVLVAGRNTELLARQAQEFRPKRIVCAADGEAAILNAIEESESELVVNALVGSAGLKPTLKAIACGKKLALANKESLVAAGGFIDVSRIRPIDSEHFGLWYLLQGRDPNSIERLIITASGGALRDMPLEAIENAPIETVLRHPNWSMGAKITIDSATMVNKLFELLEARRLFGAAPIDAYIERSSAIHALAAFKDGCVTAQFAPIDMRLAIAYAILGEVKEPFAGGVDLAALSAIDFREIDCDRYPVWRLKEPLLARPELGAVVNAANEAAIEKYRAGAIGFGGVSRLILEAFDRFCAVNPRSIDEVFATHDEVLRWAGSRRF